MSDLASQKLKRYKELKQDKSLWIPIFQRIGEYIHLRKQDFESSSPGPFCDKDIYDSTGPMANRKSAAAMIGNLWPNGGKSMRILSPRGIEESSAVKEYFEEANDVMVEALDDPKAGLVLAFDEYMNDQGSFGTSGICVLAGREGESDLSFSSWGVDEVCLDEGPSGRIEVVYREICWPVHKIIREYGENKVSEKIREAWKSGQIDKKFKILHVIEPREYTPTAKGNKAMPYLSLHIEIDTKNIIRESGFEEMPVSFTRYFKKRKEVYGRSPGMDALPDIFELNATREMRILANEQAMDPALAVEDDGILGGGVVDTSPGAINIVKPGRMSSGNPIQPLFEGKNLQVGDKSVEELKMSVNEHFNIDRLLDFNNDVQMTLGESQMRYSIRGQSLNSLFSRQINECITPMIERSVSIMFRKGKLGLMPDSPEAIEAEKLGLKVLIIPDEIAELIAAGKDFYRIVYETPAAKLMQAEEAQGVISAWEFAGQVAQANPEVFDNLDADASLEVIGKSRGAPSKIFKSREAVMAMRQARSEEAARQAENEQVSQEIGQAQGVAQTIKTLEPQGNEGS